MATACSAIAIKGIICSTIPRPLKEIKMADEHLHQSEAELSEFEQYMQQREAARDVFGGVLIESTTDSLDDIAAAAFQPEIVQGPKVEIGTRGVRTKAG